MHGMPIAVYSPSRTEVFGRNFVRNRVGKLRGRITSIQQYPGVRLKKLGAAVGAVSSSSPSTTTRSAPKINNGAAYETAESA